MKQTCENPLPLCTCVEKAETAKLLAHMLQNFQFDHFDLEYQTLGPEKGRRLCLIGTCRKCGKRLCYGTELPEDEPADDLLAEIYRWTYQLWSGILSVAPSDQNDFLKIFLELFQPEDHALVRNWLNRPETQDLMQTNRHAGKEEG